MVIRIYRPRATGFAVEAARDRASVVILDTDDRQGTALPQAAERLLGQLASPPPAPKDIEHARAARMAAVVALVDGLPLDEQPSAAALTGPLAAALSRLCRRASERA
jgi:hypothetical protein